MLQIAHGAFGKSAGVPRGGLPLAIGRKYWLRVATLDDAVDGNTVVASWSTDGTNFVPKSRLTGLANLTGQVGYVTWSFSPPSVLFDDFEVTGGCLATRPR